MTTPTLDPATIDHHVRRARAIRSRAVLDALARLPSALGRTSRAFVAAFA